MQVTPMWPCVFSEYLVTLTLTVDNVDGVLGASHGRAVEKRPMVRIRPGVEWRWWSGCGLTWLERYREMWFKTA